MLDINGEHRFVFRWLRRSYCSSMHSNIPCRIRWPGCTKRFFLSSIHITPRTWLHIANNPPARVVGIVDEIHLLNVAWHNVWLLWRGLPCRKLNRPKTVLILTDCGWPFNVRLYPRALQANIFKVSIFYLDDVFNNPNIPQGGFYRMTVIS
ncbi:hypothetical protein M758_UG181000 [Ceratodon purpureus]|nr:hypothetical protein M758_UG181000 [Ceratodon purpureus]